MVKGGGRKPAHRSGHKVGGYEDFMERNKDTPEEGAAGEEESDEEDDKAKGKKCPSCGGTGIDVEPAKKKKGQEDSAPTEKKCVMCNGTGKKQAAVPQLARDDDLEAELAAQFGASSLTRKQKEELEKQDEDRQAEKDRKEGKGEEAKADQERLAEIRKKREEAAEKKKEDAAKEKEKEEKEEKERQEKTEKDDKAREVADQVLKLVKAAKDGQLTLNQLNQLPESKKVLKPLCKKHGVKAIDKKWLSKFCDILDLKDEGNNLVISAKA